MLVWQYGYGMYPLDGRTPEELAEIAVQEISNFWNEIGIARNISELGLKKHVLSEFEPLIQKRHAIEGMQLLDEDAMRQIISKCL